MIELELSSATGGLILSPCELPPPLLLSGSISIDSSRVAPLLVTVVSAISFRPASGDTLLLVTSGCRTGGGFFFAELPVTTPGPVTGGVPFPDGPWVLTAYDTAGHEVARIDLTDLHASETPH